MPKSERPNILLIMADQHRYDYLGCAGADFIDTPHIDALAARGTRFNVCTVNSPVCAPSRIALATGEQPFRRNKFGNGDFLSLQSRTHYQHLRDHGYRTAFVGKVDLAKPQRYNGKRGQRPLCYAWGFTDPHEAEGKMHAGGSPKPLGPYGYHLQEHGLYDAFHRDYDRRRKEGYHISAHDSVLPTEFFEDAYIGRKAAEWIEATDQEDPWYMFVSFVGPHDPFDPPTEYADKYRDRAMPPAVKDSMEGKPVTQQQRAHDYGDEKILETRRQYCAATQLIDDQVGRLVAALGATGQLDNTLIIYTSDHGEMLGDHGMYTKSIMYEPSLRVPLIACGPGVRQGVVSDALTELIDVGATIVDFAGLDPMHNIDARSFMPVLAGETDSHRDETISFLSDIRCVRTATHKLVQTTHDTAEVYDLENDPNEQTNLIGEDPERDGALHRRLHARMREGLWHR